MNKTILFAIAILFTATFLSCKTCVTCTTTTGSQSFPPEEKCGSKSDVEEFEKDQKAAAAAAGNTVNCK